MAKVFRRVLWFYDSVQTYKSPVIQKVHRSASLTSWCVSPLGCEWRGEGSLSLIDGIYNCSFSSMAACCMCTLLYVRLYLCVFASLPLTSTVRFTVTLVQILCVIKKNMHSYSEFSDTVCMWVCLCLYSWVCCKCSTVYSIFRQRLTWMSLESECV